MYCFILGFFVSILSDLKRNKKHTGIIYRLSVSLLSKGWHRPLNNPYRSTTSMNFNIQTRPLFTKINATSPEGVRHNYNLLVYWFTHTHKQLTCDHLFQFSVLIFVEFVSLMVVASPLVQVQAQVTPPVCKIHSVTVIS